MCNDDFKCSFDYIDGVICLVFIDFLEWFCILEFFGFLLFKELFCCFKNCSFKLVEVFYFLVRDEVCYVGFINKVMVDFGFFFDLCYLI